MADKPKAIWQRLQAPFEKRELHYLPRNVREGKIAGQGQALGIPYVNTAAIAARLDEALTPSGWKFEWEAIELGGDHHSVKGRLTIGDPDGGAFFDVVVREDVGYPNASDDDEPLKGAVSDALKRCALLFGIGREVRAIAPHWGNCKTYIGKDGKLKFGGWADETRDSGSPPERSQEKTDAVPGPAPAAPPREPAAHQSSAGSDVAVAADPSSGTIGESYVTFPTDPHWLAWQREKERAEQYGLRPPKMELGSARAALQAATENLAKSVAREHDRLVAAEA